MDASAAAAAAALLLAVVLVVLRAARRRGRVAALLQRARAKKETARAAQVAYLRELGPVDAEVDAAAAGLTARAIAAGVQRGSLDAAAVLRAFCARAVAAHERTNCLTEHLFTRAFAAVQTLAELGPASRSLMGVPVSLKDTVGVSGFDTSNGLVRFVAQPAAADAVVVRLLSARGALPFCKTNVPQARMRWAMDGPLAVWSDPRMCVCARADRHCCPSSARTRCGAARPTPGTLPTRLVGRASLAQQLPLR